jgi:hypothetical protein
MLTSFILIIVGSVGVAFGTQTKLFGFLFSYFIYSLSRFMIACGTRGINETGYVLGNWVGLELVLHNKLILRRIILSFFFLALELVSQKKRTHAGIIFEHFFSLGQLILVAVAYFVRDWRSLAIIMIIPTIPFIAYFL